MSLLLTSADLRQLAGATRLLLRPDEHDAADAWRAEVARSMRALFGADHALVQLPGCGELYHGEGVDPGVIGRLAEAAESGAGGMRYHDPRMARLYEARRAAGGEVFTREGNERLLGVRLERTAIYGGVLRPAGLVEFCGVYLRVAGGDAMLWVSHRRAGALRHGDGAPALLEVLAPAFRVGVEALARAARPGADARGIAAALAARHGLTAREAEVAERLLAGDSNKRLAAGLGISPHTARHHTERVFAKLGVRSRKEMMARGAGAEPPTSPGPPAG